MGELQVLQYLHTSYQHVGTLTTATSSAVPQLNCVYENETDVVLEEAIGDLVRALNTGQ